jgi:hypothetical protein
MKRKGSDSDLSVDHRENKRVKVLESYLELLPIELLSNILIQATTSPLLRTSFSLVCWRWHTLCFRSNFSIGCILPHEFDQVAEHFSNYNQPIGLTFRKTQHLKERDFQPISKLTNLTSLTINGSGAMVDEISVLTNLKYLDVRFTSKETVEQLTNLRVLKTKSFNEDWKLPNLESLECSSYLPSFDPIPMTTLTQFSAKNTHTSIPLDSLKRYPRLGAIKVVDAFDSTQILDLRPHTELESIETNNAFEVVNYSKITRLGILREDINEIKALAKFTELRDLSLTRSRQNLSVLSSFGKLQSLQLNDCRFLETIGYSLSTNLTNLKLRPVGVGEFDRMVLHRLEKLESLRIDYVHNLNNPMGMLEVDSLTRLTALEVYFSRGAGCGSLKVSPNFTNLRSLKLVNTKFMNFESPLTLSNVTYLCVLGALSSKQLSLPNLEVLISKNWRGIEFLQVGSRLSSLAADLTFSQANKIHFESLRELMITNYHYDQPSHALLTNAFNVTNLEISFQKNEEELVHSFVTKLTRLQELRINAQPTSFFRQIDSFTNVWDDLADRLPYLVLFERCKIEPASKLQDY